MGVWLPTCFNIKFVFNKRKKLKQVFEGLYLFIYLFMKPILYMLVVFLSTIEGSRKDSNCL